MLGDAVDPLAATDSSGGILWQSPRRAYGSAINRANKSDYPIGYTGHYEDSESNLTYAGARYYANKIGRFYAPDPVTFNGNPFSFNRYKYANNNPYAYIDITGRLELHVTVFPKTRVNPNNRVSVGFKSPRKGGARKNQYIDSAVNKMLTKILGGVAGNAYSLANYGFKKIDQIIAFDIKPIQSYFSDISAKERKKMDSELLISAAEAIKETTGVDRKVVKSLFGSSRHNSDTHFLSMDKLDKFIDSWESKTPKTFKANFGSKNRLKLNFIQGVERQYDNDK